MTAPPPPASTLDLRPLMFETFACTLAVMSFVALVGPLARKLGLAPWQAGAAVTAGGIAWMLAARPWGIASDRHGRRRVLLGGLAGFALSYGSLCLFIVLALHWTLPSLLAFAGIVLLRGLAGGFYAAVPACTAALVADHVEAQRRAAALAGLGAASGVGMVIGPGLAGLLAIHGLVLPLLLTAALPLVALLALYRWLPREERRQPNRGLPLALGDRRLRRPLALGFVAMFSVTVAQITVGFFALDRLRLESADAARVAGIALTAVGVALILAQVLVRHLDWPPSRLIRAGGLVAAIGFAAVCFADSPPLLWLSSWWSSAPPTRWSACCWRWRRSGRANRRAPWKRGAKPHDRCRPAAGREPAGGPARLVDTRPARPPWSAGVRLDAGARRRPVRCRGRPLAGRRRCLRRFLSAARHLSAPQARARPAVPERFAVRPAGAAGNRRAVPVPGRAATGAERPLCGRRARFRTGRPQPARPARRPGRAAAAPAGTRLVPGAPDRRRRATPLLRPGRGAQHRAGLR
ncbi:MFS transporter [Pseudomonas aeruginosa]|nr:MFS transporter [Pseudomonas aeruginosa]